MGIIMHRSIGEGCDAQRVVAVQGDDIVHIGPEREALVLAYPLGEQFDRHKRGIFDIDDALFCRRSEPI